MTAMYQGRDIRPGDLVKGETSMWIVREVRPNRMRLAAGRTDVGTWVELDPDAEYEVYRAEEYA